MMKLCTFLDMVKTKFLMYKMTMTQPIIVLEQNRTFVCEFLEKSSFTS